MNLFSKAKPVTSDQLGFAGLRSITGGIIRDLYERLHRRGKAELHNCAGVALQLEGALLRTQGAAFGLFVRLGDSLVRTEIAIPAHDPLLKTLPIERFGPSEGEAKQQEVKRRWDAMTNEERALAAVETHRAIGLEARLGFDNSQVRKATPNHPYVSVT